MPVQRWIGIASPVLCQSTSSLWRSSPASSKSVSGSKLRVTVFWIAGACVAHSWELESSGCPRKGGDPMRALRALIVNTTPNPRIRRTPAHVIFSRLAQDLSHRVRNRCVSQNSHSSHLAQYVSSLFLSHLNPTSLSTCTPVQPSTRPSARPLLLSTSHGDLPCADPSNVSVGPLAGTHSPTGYEPKDLTEEDASILVKPMFFHRPSVMSTYDSAESIATPPPESDLDDEQIRNMLASPLYLQEREASAD